MALSLKTSPLGFVKWFPPPLLHFSFPTVKGSECPTGQNSFRTQISHRNPPLPMLLSHLNPFLPMPVPHPLMFCSLRNGWDCSASLSYWWLKLHLNETRGLFLGFLTKRPFFPSGFSLSKLHNFSSISSPGCKHPIPHIETHFPNHVFSTVTAAIEFWMHP